LAKVHFIEPSGNEKIVDAPEGWSLMEAAIQNGVSGILADCGGACSCGTCHVFVDPDWVGRLPAPDVNEEAMLEFVVDPEPNSRLSCQVKIDAACDGIVVRIPKSQF
jgi:2Fe-2S ferredoxin